jgi:NAD-dependent DNA ligase
MELKNIPIDSILILTPKYDGLSLLSYEAKNKAWTRGDGEYGQQSDEYFNIVTNNKRVLTDEYSIGEIIMKKDTFKSLYSDEFENPRNMVAGLLNSKTADIDKLQNTGEQLKNTIGLLEQQKRDSEEAQKKLQKNVFIGAGVLCGLGLLTYMFVYAKSYPNF